MKQWMKKLVDQFEIDRSGPGKKGGAAPGENLSEDRATLIYLLDCYTKHLFEIDSHPTRKARETFESFTKELVHGSNEDIDKTLFRLRQYFASYRIGESTFIQKTFDDFKTIIWDFADQLSEEMQIEKAKDNEMKQSLGQLREAVEANSIEDLRTKSREFINFYIESNSKKDERRAKRIQSFKKNLDQVKKQLVDAHHDMMVDHMTGAFNRKSFDEQLKNHLRLFEFSKAPVTLIMLDIDHFKKVNDTYGHDVGDFVIKECVRLTKAVFHRESDFVARIGGEEFAIILPEMSAEQAALRCEELMAIVRKEVFVQGSSQIRFTISMGLAQVTENESIEKWLKRSDEALYHSKQTGRNRLTIAAPHATVKAA